MVSANKESVVPRRCFILYVFLQDMFAWMDACESVHVLYVVKETMDRWQEWDILYIHVFLEVSCWC